MTDHEHDWFTDEDGDDRCRKCNGIRCPICHDGYDYGSVDAEGEVEICETCGGEGVI